LFKTVVKPLTFNNVINVALLLTNNSFNFEKTLTFNFENIVVLSDVISFASMVFKPATFYNEWLRIK
jgi:hypothetical protein